MRKKYDEDYNKEFCEKRKSKSALAVDFITTGLIAVMVILVIIMASIFIGKMNVMEEQFKEAEQLEQMLQEEQQNQNSNFEIIMEDINNE